MAFQRLADRPAGLGSHSRAVLSAGRGHDAPAVGTERCAHQTICHVLSAARPSARRSRHPTTAPSCPGRGHDAAAVGTERGARHPGPESPLSGSPIGPPVSASHSRAVLSSEAVTMRRPSGLNAALVTRCSWLSEHDSGSRNERQAPSSCNLSLGNIRSNISSRCSGSTSSASRQRRSASCAARRWRGEIGQEQRLRPQ